MLYQGKTEQANVDVREAIDTTTAKGQLSSFHMSSKKGFRSKHATLESTIRKTPCGHLRIWFNEQD